MATIRKRGNRYHVQIRKKDHPPITKSFSDRKTASTFAKDMESKIERGVYQDASLAEQTTLSTALKQYEETILPTNKGKDSEIFRLQLLDRELGHLTLVQIQPHTVSKYRDGRLKSVKPATVKRELGLLSRILTASEKDFGIYLPHGNPVSKIRLPKEPEGRKRRLQPGELDSLRNHMEHNSLMLSAVFLAIETGMRRGELCRMQYQDVDWDKSTLLIPETKNGQSRTIPLSKLAIESLGKLVKLQEHPTPCLPLLPLEPHSVTRAFERACKRAEIEDLRFHDLRHEATSRFFEKGLNLMEVASITGHQDLRMLKRYTHIRPETLVSRL
ncbi:tyrosine-type recombinase/integrase [Pseudomonadota bacterium]